MARNIDDPALLSSFLQKSQQYFEPKKPKDTSANLKTVQSEEDQDTETQQTPEKPVEPTDSDSGHQISMPLVVPEPMIAVKPAPDDDDGKIGVEAIAAAAQASRLSLADSKHSPASTLNRTKLRAATAASKGANENLPPASNSARPMSPPKIDSTGSKVDVPGFVTNKQKAEAFERLARQYPGAAAELLNRYKAKALSDTGEQESPTNRAADPDNVDYSKYVAVRNKGPPIRNPNYDPRESQEPVIASFAGALRGEEAGEKVNSSAATATKVKGKVPSEEDREHAQYFSTWGERQTRPGYTPARIRTIILSSLPRDATFTLVQSLVFGGTLQEIRLSPEKTTAYVTYIDPDKCEKFYDTHPNGITFASADGKKNFCGVDRVNTAEPTSGVIQAQVQCGATRAITAIGVEEDWQIRALRKIGEDKGGILVGLNDSIREDERRVVTWCFTKIVDAVRFRYYLQKDDEFEVCKVEFASDPCAVGGPVVEKVHIACKGRCRCGGIT